MLGITVVNLIPSIKPQYNAPPANGSYDLTRSLFWLFMYLTALGSGGIKPCVSSFGGGWTLGQGRGGGGGCYHACP
jgi:dipeptide/tripeptide permease